MMYIECGPSGICRVFRVFSKGRSVVNEVLGFALVFLTGLLGFLLARRLKVPCPGLIGSIFATGILNAGGYYPALSLQPVSFLAKAATGVMMGRQIDRQLIVRIKGIACYVLLSTGGMFVLSLLTGWVFYKLTDVSLTTALISAAAGGITEMTTFGMSINANVVVIVFIQVLRVVTFLTLTPYIATLVEKMSPPKKRMGKTSSDPDKIYFGRTNYVPLGAAALCGALLFEHLGIPNGAMIGSMAASGLLAVALNKTYRFEPRLRNLVQVVLGSVIGQRITPEIVESLQQLFWPAFFATGIMLAGCTILAFVLYRVSDLDLVTCVLCTAPAGLSQVGLVAEELGADSLTASIFHVVRLLSIIAFYPGIVMLIA